MKKKLVKSILKAIVTTAMTTTIFIVGESEVKAGSFEDFAEMNGMTSEELAEAMDVRPALEDEYVLYLCSLEGISAEQHYKMVDEFANSAECADILSGKYIAGKTTTVHTNMLNKVNADRMANGVGALTWNVDLEVIAKIRAVEIMCNVETEDFMNAYDSGVQETINEVVHRGHREGLGENAIVSFYSGVKEATANQNWIASAGHHAVRVTAGYTQYACASYTDPLTGMETWVELFSDGTPITNTSTFDYMRYAQENPDVAAVFGQNSIALYNHYITCGAAEGRKAYYTNGTLIRL